MKKPSHTTWIFLRGLSRESAHWGNLPKDFEKKFDCDVVVIDLPGMGEFFEAKSPLSLDANVEFVRRQWEEKKPKGAGRPYLFALSLGGMVAVRWMHTFPNEIAGGVLINTSLRGVSPFFRRISPSAYFSLFTLFADRSVRGREQRILQLTSQQQDWDEGELRKRIEIQKKHPVGKINAFRQILAAMSMRDGDKAPVQPVLILNSLGDLLVHPDCSRAIARTWNVPLRRHAWAGHDLPLDDPNWTINAVADWFATLQPQRETKTKTAKSK